MASSRKEAQRQLLSRIGSRLVERAALMSGCREEEVVEKTVGPVLAEVTGEESMGRVPFSAVLVVGNLKLRNPIGCELRRRRCGCIVHVPETLQENRKCLRERLFLSLIHI